MCSRWQNIYDILERSNIYVSHKRNTVANICRGDAPRPEKRRKTQTEKFRNKKNTQLSTNKIQMFYAVAFEFRLCRMNCTLYTQKYRPIKFAQIRRRVFFMCRRRLSFAAVLACATAPAAAQCVCLLYYWIKWNLLRNGQKSFAVSRASTACASLHTDFVEVIITHEVQIA